MRQLLLAAALGALACGSDRHAAAPDLPPDAGVVSEAHDAGAAAPADAGAPPDVEVRPDAGVAAPEPDAGTPVSAPDAGVATNVPDAGTPPTEPITRFVALGDQGKGNAEQFAVGAAMKTVCEARGGCSFGVILGDNFYPTGVQAVDDQQFQSKFEQPYKDLPFPFHVALGNHDYGANGAGVEFWKGQSEIDYSQRSTKWIMPSAYYRFREGPVDFVALDTNGILLSFGDKGDQERDVPQWIAQAAGPWRIVYGHHPYLSNGPHGNAGSYDKITFDFIPAGGKTIRDFIESKVCGKVDVYLCGHDHSLQDLGATCGTNFLVSGGGASVTDLPGSNPVEFQAAVPGFLLLEADAHHLVMTWFDQNAHQLHQRTLTK